MKRLIYAFIAVCVLTGASPTALEQDKADFDSISAEQWKNIGSLKKNSEALFLDSAHDYIRNTEKVLVKMYFMVPSLSSEAQKEFIREVFRVGYAAGLAHGLEE